MSVTPRRDRPSEAVRKPHGEGARRPIPGTSGWYHTLRGPEQDRLVEAWKQLVRREISTANIAKATGLAPNTVQCTRSGDKNFTKFTAEGIAKALGTTLPALLAGEGVRQ